MVAYCVSTIISPDHSHGPTDVAMATDSYRDLAIQLYAAAKLGLWLAVFAAIFVPIERVFALHSQKIFRKGIAVDLGYYFLTGLLPGLILAPPISLAVLVIHHFIPGGVLAGIAAWPVWLKACATMMVGETAYYWAHRLSHQIPFLWRFHAVHHSAEQLDFLVNTRMHPVDLVWSRMIMLTPIFALGLANPLRFDDGLVATAILLTGSMWGYFIHSNVRWRLGPFEWLLTTPAFHHWHHTNDDQRRDCNYASMFPWLDRIFGTHHLPNAWPERYGIDQPMPDSLAGQFIHPLAPSRPLLPAKDTRVAQ
jgi:sterol desaturase/sphingolipid hydroxylase (fatty acid hydroxylase superfamily)